MTMWVGGGEWWHTAPVCGEPTQAELGWGTRTRLSAISPDEKRITEITEWKREHRNRFGVTDGLCEEANCVFGEVGDDEVGAGAADAEEGFGDGAVGVQPAAGEGGVEHGVFAGDLVGAEGEIEALAGGADDVEVREGGLHEEQVGAFGHVERDLAHGLTNVSPVHLIAAAVAELRRGVGGLAEGAVKGGGELGGVAHDGRVGEGGGVERGADGFDAAVHHVGGGDDVGAGGGEGDGGAGEEWEGGVVVDVVVAWIFQAAGWIFGAAGAIVNDDAAVAVGGVLAEADVGDEDERVDRAGGFEGAEGLLDDSLL